MGKYGPVNRAKVPKALKRAVLAEGKCRACGTTQDLTIDHIMPRSLGGTNNRYNLQCLCRRCNIKKANRYKEYFKEHAQRGLTQKKCLPVLKPQSIEDVVKPFIPYLGKTLANSLVSNIKDFYEHQEENPLQPEP